MYKDEIAGVVVWVVILVVLLVIAVGGGMYIYPMYNVYSQRRAGEAELARAESNRRIKIAEAEAAKESAQFLADAEITRAEGVAKANQIIGASLQGNEAYLHYLWIQGLESGNSAVVYIPTEAGLPILEAGRRNWRSPEQSR